MEAKTKPLPSILALVALFSQIIPDRVQRTARRVPVLSRTISSLLDRAAPEGMVDVRVSRGALRGAWLRLDLRQEREYWLGAYERRLVAAMSDFCRSGMVVYDLGANIGYTALICARIVGRGGRVYAFEPLDENLQRMRAHLARNDTHHNVVVIAAAVSDREGSEAFLIHESGAMGKLAGSGERATHYVGQRQVASIRLDDFVFREGHPAPDLIKLDIEGGGVKAFPGMARVLAEARPLLIMELHGPEEKQAALDTLCPLSYRLHSMAPGYALLKDEHALRQQWRQHIVAVPG
jgi:FkbM family methyltransferase